MSCLANYTSGKDARSNFRAVTKAVKLTTKAGCQNKTTAYGSK